VPGHRSLPRLPRYLVRLPETRESLDRWAPISFVRGIQGYGKTALVGGWLRDQPDSVRRLWVNARVGEDAKAFYRRLARELRNEGLADRPVSDTERGKPSRRNPRAEPLDALECAAGFAKRDQPVVLVIDDAHWLRDESILAGLVDAVARHPHLHVILCSRGRHPVEDLAAGVVETATIRARALLFTPSQIGDLARSMGVSLSTERAEEIHSALGGWAAPVRLVLDEIEGPTAQLPLTRAGDYLREVVLPGVEDQEALRQVMRFSLAQRLTQRLIRDLSDDHDPETLVRLVESSGLAERNYQPGDVELVFPCFVRDTLRETFTAREPDNARAMHRRLARWFATHDDSDGLLLALRHAVAGEDWDQLDHLWIRHSAELSLEHPGALFEVLDALPDRALTARPGMRVARTLSQVAASAVDSDEDARMITMRAYLEASRRLAVRIGLSALPLHDLLYVGTGFMISLRVEGNLNGADQVGDQIEQLATALIADGGNPGDRLGWFHLQRGVTQTLTGRPSDAARRYQLSWQHRRQTAPHVAANAAANLALTHALAADTHAAQRWLARHRDIDTSRTWGQHLVDVAAHVASALLALDSLDADGCRSELDHLGGGSAPLELWPYVAYVDAQCGLHDEDPLTALARLDAAQTAHHPDLARGPAAAMLLARARADLLLAAGKGEHARTLLAKQSSSRDPSLAVTSARLGLLAGDPGAARRIAADLLWKETTDNRARLELLLIGATASQRMNER